MFDSERPHGHDPYRSAIVVERPRPYGDAASYAPPEPHVPDPMLEVHQEIMTWSSVIAAGQARIIELMATHGDSLTGGDDPAAWLAWAGGMKPSTAKRHIRLAEKLIELPQIKESFSKGELSFEKTETIVRVASPENQHDVLTWAQSGTCAQLGRVAAGFRRAKTTQAEANSSHRDRALDYHFTDDGSFRLRAQMPAEQGALVAQAIEAAEEALWEQEKTFQGHDLTESQRLGQNLSAHDSRPARRADGLVAISETFLAHGLSDRPVAERYEVLVHVDEAALEGDDTGTSELEEGVGISTETARRIACDCTIAALLEKDGVPLKLSRKRRTISPGLRKAITARDRHCVFPGCTATRRTQGHHVKHWIGDLGKTEPENIALLCPRHHRLVHEGRYTMTFLDQRARFFRPDGSEVERGPTQRTISEAELAAWTDQHAGDLDAWAHTIDSYSLADAVSSLCYDDFEPPDLRDTG